MINHDNSSTAHFRWQYTNQSYVCFFSALQRRKAVTAYLSSKQLLPFGFAVHFCGHQPSIGSTIRVCWAICSGQRRFCLQERFDWQLTRPSTQWLLYWPLDETAGGSTGQFWPLHTDNSVGLSHPPMSQVRDRNLTEQTRGANKNDEVFLWSLSACQIIFDSCWQYLSQKVYKIRYNRRVRMAKIIVSHELVMIYHSLRITSGSILLTNQHSGSWFYFKITHLVLHDWWSPWFIATRTFHSSSIICL